MCYGYVADILVKRQPFRKAHLEHWKEELDGGKLRLAGAFKPADGAMFVFHGLSKEAIQEKASADPYVKAGLVTGVSTVDWSVVIGADSLAPPP